MDLFDQQLQQFYCHPMLVDPRPYTYQYRKPRYGNPTFQSRNLYESLYHRYPYQSNDYFAPQERAMYSSVQKLQKPDPYVQSNRQLQRNQSEFRQRKSYENQYTRPVQSVMANPERQTEGYKLPSINQNTERAKAESNLGNNLGAERGSQRVLPKKQGFQRFRIYQRQQKPFNIISCYPKEQESNRLRNFPKLTLEDKLIERGSYHNFKEERL